ncbi:MAG: MBL fold metallo-hydrolase [Actinomycetes bacterium]
MSEIREPGDLVLPEFATPTGAGDPAGARITFIGNATVLIEWGGLTLLTDPNFLHAGMPASIGYGLFTIRTKNPAMSIDDLPPLDAVVLSHLHGDHWDSVARRQLPKDLPILTTKQAAKKVAKQGFREAVGMSTWSIQRIIRGDAEIAITSVPGQHGPGPVAKALPDVMGSVLDLSWAGRRRLRIYITGDTLLTSAVAEVAATFSDIDLCLLHLGGTKLGPVLLTMDAEQGVGALRTIQPRRAIPIHYDDYRIFTSPISDFDRLAKENGFGPVVRYLERGETYVAVPAVSV